VHAADASANYLRKKKQHARVGGDLSPRERFFPRNRPNDRTESENRFNAPVKVPETDSSEGMPRFVVNGAMRPSASRANRAHLFAKESAIARVSADPVGIVI